jgi:hypothetical protein
MHINRYTYRIASHGAHRRHMAPMLTNDREIFHRGVSFQAEVAVASPLHTILGSSLWNTVDYKSRAGS